MCIQLSVHMQMRRTMEEKIDPILLSLSFHLFSISLPSLTPSPSLPSHYLSLSASLTFALSPAHQRRRHCSGHHRYRTPREV